MNIDECEYSRMAIGLPYAAYEQSRAVECPECGAIRSVKLDKKPVFYPIHNTLMGTTQARERWWKYQGNKWKLVTGE